jgi:hypothetical protein
MCIFAGALCNAGQQSLTIIICASVVSTITDFSRPLALWGVLYAHL